MAAIVQDRRNLHVNDAPNYTDPAVIIPRIGALVLFHKGENMDTLLPLLDRTRNCALERENPTRPRESHKHHGRRGCPDARGILIVRMDYLRTPWLPMKVWCFPLPRYPPVDPFPPIEGNRLLSFPPFLDPPVDEGLLPWYMEDCSQVLPERGKPADDDVIRDIFIAFEVVNGPPLLLKALIDRLQDG